MSYNSADYNIELEADYNMDFDVDLDVDVDIDYDKDVDVNNDYDIDVDIDGNEAVFNVDVQAFGSDTSTELNLVVVTVEGEWSSILATGYSAAD